VRLVPMPDLFTEKSLIEMPAAELFSQLGWEALSAEDELLGDDQALGRETKSEVVLKDRLRSALERLNPTLPPEPIRAAIDEFVRDRSALSLSAANREIYDLLKGGIAVSIPDPVKGGQKVERVRLIDWNNPVANEFLVVRQFAIQGRLYSRRPDLVGFVNGIPLIVLEFKKPGVPARAAFDENLISYRSDIPQLFWYNAFLIASNGTDSRIGTITADWERCFEWKRIQREDEPRRVSLDVMIRGTCEPARLLDLVENFTLFSDQANGVVKVLGQNHQFLGVNNAIAASLKAREHGHGRAGVFWQTQGSGKSFSMVFYAQKILRKIPGNWTFVIVTDRVELDDQIAKTFKACHAVSAVEADNCHAQTGAHLRELLRGNHRYVFTLIHKFQAPELLCDRRDVVVLTDEAHRSQYDTLALNMRAALPNALFLAFTGTPLIAGEERTRDVFGDYVSIYDFQQSVEDGATVPLYYENRTPALHLKNPDLNDDLYDLIEEADLDENSQRRFERELGRQYQLITRDDRLEAIAKDIVQHFLGRGFQGKAMVVSIDKATALRTYDKVRKYWALEREKAETELKELLRSKPGHDPDRQIEVADRVRELNERLEMLRTTDMALIVSPAQNEIEEMNRLGLDIAPHRKRMNGEPLDEKFKYPEDRLRLVFVCAMWLTGFDAPSCSTIYLDKPMRNHTLMQTIARANRVYPGKQSGLIVDYANVFASLERALAIYGKGTAGIRPVQDKTRLLEELENALTAVSAFCDNHGVDLRAISRARSLQRVQLLGDAVNSLISPDPVRREFLGHERLVRTLYRAVKPDPAVLRFISSISCVLTTADAIREKIGDPPTDLSALFSKVNELLDRSIEAEGFRIAETRDREAAVIDLASVDFEALSRRFSGSKTKNLELEKLKAAIRAQLEKIVRLNKTRIDYLEKFEALIDSYNAGSRNIDELFQELLTLSRSLTEEQERHVRENLSEEELAVFDILTRPGPELGPEERDEVKKVAHLLLERVKTVLTLDWRKRAEARAKVRIAIEDVLDDGLPRAYTPELYRGKCNTLFEHIYENYAGQGASVYARSA
jgi:type I restriction enzyme R subunit